MKTLLLVFLCTYSLFARAEMLKLAVITSEFDKNSTDYYLETDDHDFAHSMRYVTKDPKGVVLKDESLPVEEIVNNGGIVLVEGSGYDVIRLELEHFTIQDGGTLKLNYLYSALSGLRYVKRLKLNPTLGKFQLFDLEEKPVNRFFVRVNWSRFFGAIGVKEIQTSFVRDIWTMNSR
jgi:hypothetical protein